MKAAILIVDDHDVVRRGLKALLGGELPDCEFGVARTTPEALSQLGRQFWNVVVLDLRMPDASGLETIAAIKEGSPRSRVLVFSMYSEADVGVRAIQAGADGFVKKDSPVEELVEAIRRILDGHRYVSPLLAERLAEALAHPRASGVASLSNREHYVLKRIGQGRTTGEIADEMKLSVKTISTYRSRVLEKLHLHTTAELVRYAIEHKLTD